MQEKQQAVRLHNACEDLLLGSAFLETIVIGVFLYVMSTGNRRKYAKLSVTGEKVCFLSTTHQDIYFYEKTGYSSTSGLRYAPDWR